MPVGSLDTHVFDISRIYDPVRVGYAIRNET